MSLLSCWARPSGWSLLKFPSCCISSLIFLTFYRNDSSLCRPETACINVSFDAVKATSFTACFLIAHCLSGSLSACAAVWTNANWKLPTFTWADIGLVWFSQGLSSYFTMEKKKQQKAFAWIRQTASTSSRSAVMRPDLWCTMVAQIMHDTFVLKFPLSDWFLREKVRRITFLKENSPWNHVNASPWKSMCWWREVGVVGVGFSWVSICFRQWYFRAPENAQ